MIVYDKTERILKLDTKNTTYAMKIVHDKFVAHLYYGAKTDCFKDCYNEKIVNFAPYVAEIGEKFSLDTIFTELSFFDSGDTKDVSIKIENGNGDCVTLFYYRSHRIFNGRLAFENMPY